ncbi:MAG TPA: cache domain-containing protein [Desulfuromonadaceae bacterium]
MRLLPYASIRLKLTIATLVPLMAAIALCWLIGASIITTRLFSQAQQTVDTDLNSAHEMLRGELARLGDTIRLTALSPELSAALRTPAGPASAPALQFILRNERLGFLTVVDRFGLVRYRAANPSMVGDSRQADKLITDALTGVAASGIAQLTPEQAGRENPQLPAQMSITVRPTPHGRIYTRQVEGRGLFLVAAAPVPAPGGGVGGAVYGGVLLNNDNRLVDRITRVVFQRGDTAPRNVGSATIFLDDVRIATTVPDQQGQAAIGSLMSAEVFAAVSRGERWSGPAFVLNERNFSAYEPLRDYGGTVVGALYAGMPERPYRQLRTRVNLIFSGVLVVVALIGLALSAWLGAGMARPIRAVEEGARRIAAGEHLPDIVLGGHDEIAILAEEFNIMKHRVAEREEEILALNHTLEEKVAQRTAQLEEKNQWLLVAQQELARAERLVGIGMLASGVAHEINNPLAIIRGNAELLQLAQAHGSHDHDEVETIIRQVGRIERIVANLRTFSRGGTKRPGLFPLEGLLDGILDQVGHQVPLEGCTIERGYRGVAIALEGDEDQLRQVFTNLVVNGLQAMAGSGMLRVDAALDEEEGRVRVAVADSGPGISPEQREKIFTPFYSTKRDGTGLGLAVSYGIVRDHGGEIRVGGEPGAGAVFTVVLPLRQGA